LELNPTLFGGAPIQDRAVTRTTTALTDTPEVPLVPLEQSLGATIKAGPNDVAAEEIARRNTFQASKSETVAAAIRTSNTMDIVNWIQHPKFAPDESPASAQLKTVDINFTKDEMDYFLKRTGMQDGQYRIDRIKARRQDEELKEDNFWTAAAVGFADPTNFVPGGAALRAARLGKLAGMATAGATQAGLSAISAAERPISTAEIGLAMTLETIAGGFMVPSGRTKSVVRDGKVVQEPVLVPSDPALPTEALTALARTPEKAREVSAGVVKEVPVQGLSAHATSDAGDIILTQEGSTFKLELRNGGKVVESTEHATEAEAKEAFADAVDYDSATIGAQSWKESADTLTIPMEKAAKDVVMYEDIGLRKTEAPEIPEDLHPTKLLDPVKAAVAVEKQLDKANLSFSQKVGHGIMMNIHKTMSSYGGAGAKFAGLVVDDNMNLTKNSVESLKRGVQADLHNTFNGYNDKLLEALAENGAGTLQRIFSKDAAAVQKRVEREVANELRRRDQAIRQGRDYADTRVDKKISDMADAIGATTKKSDMEQKAAQVEGADGFEHSMGYLPREWVSLHYDDAVNKLMKYGHDAKQAKAAIIKMTAESMADANAGMPWETAHDVATATINRSIRKGLFEDSSFIANKGGGDTKTIRDLLHQQGLSGERLERAMKVMTGITDEKAKASFAKHRVNLDYTASIHLGDDSINITDLLNSDVKDLMDRHINKVSAEVAFAQKGFKKASDIDNLRAEIMEELRGDMNKQKQASELFEGIIANLRGEAHGEQVSQFFRNMNALSRLTVLGGAGLWQLTEYATMMYQYGALKTIKYAIQELPPFKHLMDTGVLDKATSTQLKDILVGATTNSTRLTPYVQRYADNMEMPGSATLSARLEHATQLVPMLNGMKYVHGHQARIMANHVVDSINDAVRGNIKMAQQLEKYGLDASTLAKLKDDVTKHGMDVEKWSDGAWSAARPAVMKMMDEGVLHARLGDQPAWAVMSSVGKFLSMYRGFVFAAHNKLLAGTMARDGFAGVGLIMLYQAPITALVTQANTVLNGKKPLKDKELVLAAFGKMGMAGMFGDVASAVMGNSPGKVTGLIPLERGGKLVSEGRKMLTDDRSPSAFAHAVYQMTPALAILPPLRAMEAFTIKEMKANEPKKVKVD
jgi:hypothetical protein